jgi:hypothetical protein
VFARNSSRFALPTASHRDCCRILYTSTWWIRTSWRHGLNCLRVCGKVDQSPSIRRSIPKGAGQIADALEAAHKAWNTRRARTRLEGEPIAGQRNRNEMPEWDFRPRNCLETRATPCRTTQSAARWRVKFRCGKPMPPLSFLDGITGPAYTPWGCRSRCSNPIQVSQNIPYTPRTNRG